MRVNKFCVGGEGKISSKSPSAVGSKVITKIVRAEEGEPGDEATKVKPSAQ